ncbi:MAG: hypothetical protein M1826_002256 [Phylliscum demangeonii]|nr:MAG: hypothetical protein M1826_002256 [Phylliscum demangeonii]
MDINPEKREQAKGGEEDDETDVSGDDPIVREYDVFLNDSLAEKLLLLQYPNRDRQQSYADLNQTKPRELRVKPQSGLVEVDIPLNIYDNCDRQKALRFGDSLKKSTEARAGGSLGLAGGFGIGSGTGPARASENVARGPRRDGEDREMDLGPEAPSLTSYIAANTAGRVLNKQTLGGQIRGPEEGCPIYMLGVFDRDQLHLVPIDAMAQLRPQFHHVDATAEQERSSARAQREAMQPARQQESRAVQMTVKSADGEEMDTAQTITTLKTAQEETWRSLDYVDESSALTSLLKSAQAWEAYQKLFVPHTAEAPSLQSHMTATGFLDAISASPLAVEPAVKKETEERPVQGKAKSKPSRPTK